MRENRIYLVGFMGAGKTTLGRQLAREFNWKFHDTDEIIIRDHGPIGNLFDSKGEQHFRQLERTVVRSLLEPPFVMATGGGTACFHENINFMKEMGLVIFLKISEELLLYRLKKDPNIIQRPKIKSLSEMQLLELYQQRLKFYEQAHITHHAMDQTDILIEKIKDFKR
jgi:shikimate kinase